MQTVQGLKEIDCSAKQSPVLGENLMYVVYMDQVRACFMVSEFHFSCLQI